MDVEAPQESNGRKYRSKKQRPCDLCRTRKIQCRLRGDRVACELCQRLHRQCTFVLGPLRRNHRPRNNGCSNAEVGAGEALRDAQRTEPNYGDMTLPNDTSAGGQADMGMDVNMESFWLPPTEHPQTFNSRDVPSLLMNWYTMGDPLGRSPVPERRKVKLN